MKCKYISFLLIISVILTFFSHSLASVEWGIQKTLRMEKSALDVAVSLNGKWIFVLTDQGNILIYSADGKLKDKIDVGNHVDQIKVGQRENILFLNSRKHKTVQIIALDFIQHIDVSGSPFKGPADAPVVIAVFSDFQ